MMSQTSLSSGKERAYRVAILRLLKRSGVKFVRYLAYDVTGNPRTKVVPLARLSTDNLDHVVAIASCVMGGFPSFADMLLPGTGLDAKYSFALLPDVSSLQILPYAPDSAMVLCNLQDPQTMRASPYCARSLLSSAMQRLLQEHNLVLQVGVELEFCLYDRATNEPLDRTTFASTGLLNIAQEFISDLYQQLEQQDIAIELIHSESALGQLEVVLKYSSDALAMADAYLLARETILHVARQHQYKAVFLPKVDAMRAGNGCHWHFSLADPETLENLIPSSGGRKASFWQESASDISSTGQFFLEGILQHISALMALTAPTENSFRRIGPGCWTGSGQGWGFEDKEAPLRIVANPLTCTWENMEYKVSDHTANPYLSIAGILLAGMDGLKHQRPLRPPLSQTPAEGLLPLPSSAAEALEALETDTYLCAELSSALVQGYVVARRCEVERAATMTLEDEVAEALMNA